MHKIIHIALTALLMVAIFDPADRITHMKVPLFIAVWALTMVSALVWRQRPAVPLTLLNYTVVLGVVIPLLSICGYLLRGGRAEPYWGFEFLKGYLFLTLAIPLALERIDLARLFSYLLTGLSVLSIALNVGLWMVPGAAEVLWPIGDSTGSFETSIRGYGGLEYSYGYFHASPMIAFSIAYFAYQLAKSGARRTLWYSAMLALNVAGMFMSGTRNNVLVSVFLPLAVWFWYSRKKLRIILATVAVVALSLLLGWRVVGAALSPNEADNAIKLQHLHDYASILSSPGALLLGQGVGSYFYSTAFAIYTPITEVTYIELLREYGLLLFLPLLFCLLYPLVRLANRGHKNVHYIYIAFAFYLLMCISNPLLISSSGMLFLSIVAYKTFCTPSRAKAQLQMPLPVVNNGNGDQRY